MNALDVLAQLKEAYASTAIYQDHGTVTLVAAPQRTARASGTFRTEFERALGRFVFEFTPPDDVDREPFLIRAEGWSVVEPRFPLRPPTTLGLAIAGLTGVTWGAAHIVPRMLMPEVVGGRALWSAPHPKLIRREQLGGERCAVLDIGIETIFVGESTLTVRRVLGSHDIVYEPQIDW